MKIYSAITILLILLIATVARAERLAITSEVANIRSGPGTEHDILWKVEKYHPIIVIDQSNSWYHFKDFEGDKGWVHQSLAGKMETVITTNEISNIRSGPGTENNILFKVEKGIPFKVLSHKGSWIQIEHADGDKGWINKKLVW
jgi:SH3-like domain-containing protein